MKIILKMNKKLKSTMLLPLSALFFAAPSAFATPTVQLPAVLEGVTLSPSVTTKDSQKLQLVGAGLRSKKVLMINVRVYVGVLFVADLAKFKKSPDEALKSVSEAAPTIMQLHFLRDVAAEKVQNSFKEALEKNEIDLKKSEVQKFLDAVSAGGEAKKGTSLVVLGAQKSDGSQVITYEDANAKTTSISGGPGFIQDIFSIWLGQPSDEGLAKLKTDILK
jgi:hypothetical protein